MDNQCLDVGSTCQDASRHAAGKVFSELRHTILALEGHTSCLSLVQGRRQWELLAAT